MAEKVIGEIRFVETDDGFRIEVKGDKERLGEMHRPTGFGFGKRFWRGMWGPGPRGRGKGGHWSHGCGPGFGPWGWWSWEEDEFEEDDSTRTPPKDV